MKKMNFKWLVMLCMSMGIATVAKAQIYSSEDCFYAKEGESKVQYVVKFDHTNDRVWLKSVPHGTVRNNLAKSENYYENEVWTDKKDNVNMYEYDSHRSTSAREVYKRKDTRGTNEVWNPAGFYVCTSYVKGYRYVAFSTDSEISSFIMWFEDEKDNDGEIKNRRDFSRVPKEDLLPKAVNDDFLH